MATDQALGILASRLEELNRVGAALSAERNTPRLLELILTKAREITASDAGSLYIVEHADWGAVGRLAEMHRRDGRDPVRARHPPDRESLAGHLRAHSQRDFVERLRCVSRRHSRVWLVERHRLEHEHVFAS